MQASSQTRPDRRAILKTMAAVGAAAGLNRWARAEAAARDTGKPRPCLFTKPLQNRPFAQLPEVLIKSGIDAVDLTCRSKGHVLPERVAEDLPAAHELLAKAGIAIPMITTEITDVSKGHAEAIVKTAAGLGIRHLKLGYYSYENLNRIEAALAEVKARLRDIAALCKAHGVTAGFHNHCGLRVGAGMWDIHGLIQDLPREAITSYFDLRHATVEGGDGGWRIGLGLLAPRIRMLAVKDFFWSREGQGAWKAKDVPLGEGMVRCEEALKRLKALRFAGPISLHVEYAAIERSIGSREDQAAVESIRRDWATLKTMLGRAGLA
ncbi:MAG TPA: TIM barrel protein [Phycisphaerae bacterium]|nr:TIM barrel protein [Phycisphaerae bacterium]HRY67641.1 TIM barrel protein [Phycisphaerae bacterium]HSA25028.1 TIM barrel protein [Phycisphaerae bacterium]